MKKFALSALIAFAATSALAQTTTVHEEYYVVRDPATKNAPSWTRSRPTTTTIVDHGIFDTRPKPRPA